MSNQISSQAAQLWRTVTAPETANTYKQALAITWSIVKEVAILVWLVICLTLVAADWFWTTSINAGRRARIWVNHFKQPDTRNMAAEVGKALLSVGKSGVAFTLSQAREQLGLPEKQESVVELSTPQTFSKVEPSVATATSPAAAPKPTVVQDTVQPTEISPPTPALADEDLDDSAEEGPR